MAGILQNLLRRVLIFKLEHKNCFGNLFRNLLVHRKCWFVLSLILEMLSDEMPCKLPNVEFKEAICKKRMFRHSFCTTNALKSFEDLYTIVVIFQRP